MSSDEQRIRDFAYQIWQSEGCPHGEDERHWEMARKLVEAEKGAPQAKPASRPRKPATKPTDATPQAKPASRPRKPATKPTDATPKSKATSAAKAAPAAKPRASRAAPKADTDAAAGTPETIRKPRAPRAKKES